MNWFLFVCLFVCNRGDAIQYHGGLQSRELGQVPMLLVFLTSILGRNYHLTPVNRWSDCIGYRIEIVCLIGTLSTILQYCTHIMKPSDPLLLADVTLCCGMYPAGKVDISWHLATQSDHNVGELLEFLYIVEFAMNMNIEVRKYIILCFKVPRYTFLGQID